MKKILLLFASICIVVSGLQAQTQLEKGKILAGVTSTLAMGGSEGSELFGLGFGSTKYKHGSEAPETHYKSFTYNILPKGGYFVMDNLVAGLEIALSGHRERDVEDDDVYKMSDLGFGPFVRYYYPLEKIYPFAEAELLFGSHRDTWGDEVEKYPMLIIGFSLGAALPLGEMVTVDGSIGYTRAQWTWEDVEEGGSNKEICSGLGIRIGFSIYL
ncbi:MAG: hypothetical protein MUE37_01990 [Bacteroidales bacterium]|nr:hypothetical protein [Bacteroidales bacterium]